MFTIRNFVQSSSIGRPGSAGGRIGLAAAGAVLMALAAAGCGEEPTGPADGPGLKLNVFVRGASGVEAAVRPAVHAAGSPAASVVTARAAVVIGGVKLETAGGSTQDFVSEESRVIELDLSGDAVTAILVSPPAGSYKEVEISVDKLEPGNPVEQPLIDRHPELADASVVVEGTVTTDGGGTEPFTFATPLDSDVEVALSPALEVTVGSGVVRAFALVIDVGAWFDDGSGGLLDPTDPADRSAIEAAMGASFDAFEDDDEDGIEG